MSAGKLTREVGGEIKFDLASGEYLFCHNHFHEEKDTDNITLPLTNLSKSAGERLRALGHHTQVSYYVEDGGLNVDYIEVDGFVLSPDIDRVSLDDLIEPAIRDLLESTLDQNPFDSNDYSDGMLRVSSAEETVEIAHNSFYTETDYSEEGGYLRLPALREQYTKVSAQREAQKAATPSPAP